MSSPAWKHRRRVLEAQAHPAEQSGTGVPRSHETFLAAVQTACSRISEVPRGPKRDEVKRAFYDELYPEIRKYIATGANYRNPALTQVMIWAFDLGEIESAWEIADIADKQEQPMPERFKRSLRNAVADFLFDWAARQYAAGKNPEPYFGEMFRRIIPENGNQAWTVHQQIRLKYVKLALQHEHDPAKALELCNLAEQIDPVRAGVKTRKAKLEKELNQ